MEKKTLYVTIFRHWIIIIQGIISGDSYNCSNLLPEDSFQAAVQTERALSRVIRLHLRRPRWPAHARADTRQDRSDRKKRFEMKTWDLQGFPTESSAHVHKATTQCQSKSQKKTKNKKPRGIKLVGKDIKTAVMTTLRKLKMRDGNMSMYSSHGRSEEVPNQISRDENCHVWGKIYTGWDSWQIRHCNRND